MYFLLIGLIVVAALLLCFVVMIQNSKGGGLASSFASSNQIMGVRKTTDFLEKATWTLAVVIAVFCIVSAYLLPTRAELGHDSVLMENAMEDNAVNPETLPDFDMPAQEGSAE